MGNLFKTLADYNLLVEFADVLDWIITDKSNFFPKDRGWEKAEKDKFTREAKKMLPFKEENILHGGVSNYSKIIQSSKKSKESYIAMSYGGSFSDDILRHLRNGIAHGRTTIESVNGVLYIRIEDYNPQNVQSAYMFFPLNIIKKIHRIYTEIEQQIGQPESTKIKSGKQRKNQSKKKAA